MFFGGLFLLLLVLLLADQPAVRRSSRFWPVLLLALFAFPLLAMFGMMGFGSWNWMHGSGVSNWWGFLVFALTIAGVAVIGYFLVGRSASESEG